MFMKFNAQCTQTIDFFDFNEENNFRKSSRSSALTLNNPT